MWIQRLVGIAYVCLAFMIPIIWLWGVIYMALKNYGF